MNESLLLVFSKLLYIVALIGLGVALLLIYRPKACYGDADFELPKWFENLDKNAQAVHIMEWKKELPKMYSIEWLKAYWNGNRTLFAAFWYLTFASAPILIVLSVMNSYLLPHTFAMQVISSVSFTGLYAFRAVAIWRCANNSTPSYRLLGKVIVVLSLLHALFMLA